MSFTPVLAANMFADQFDPRFDFTWHSLFWAGSPNMGSYSDTNAVSSWVNDTGETNATQGTGTDQPLFVAADANFNNKPSINFDGTNDDLLAIFGSGPSYTSGVSFVIVFKLDVATGTRRIIDGSTVNYNSLLINAGNWEVRNGSTVVGGTADTNLHAAVLFFDSSGNDQLLFEGDTNIDSDAGSNQTSGIRLGERRSGSNNMDGQIAFVGVYEGRVMDDASWVLLRDWIRDEYGVTPWTVEETGDVAGTGALTANRLIEQLRSGDVAGVATLAADRVVERLRTGSVAGTGTVTADRIVEMLRTGSVAGTGAVSGAGWRHVSGLVAATATLTAAGLPVRVRTGSVDGSGVLWGRVTLQQVSRSYFGAGKILSGLDKDQRRSVLKGP